MYDSCWCCLFWVEFRHNVCFMLKVTFNDTCHSFCVFLTLYLKQTMCYWIAKTYNKATSTLFPQTPFDATWPVFVSWHLAAFNEAIELIIIDSVIIYNFFIIYHIIIALLEGYSPWFPPATDHLFLSLFLDSVNWNTWYHYLFIKL